MTGRWISHTPYSNPGPHRALLRQLPRNLTSICQVARNVIGHYRAELPALGPERRDEVNSRWLRRILDTDQVRHPVPLDAPRDPDTRVAGCCRDHALFVVSVLREQGVPARIRVGFANYLEPGHRIDHAVVEHWSADRWVHTDPEMPIGSVPFDPNDIQIGPHAPFQSAAHAWNTLRHDRDAVDRYPIPRGSAFTVSNLIRTYLAYDLCHRYGDETLLWDAWPALDQLITNDELVDTVAELLIVAESGDQTAERELVQHHHRLRPGDIITQLSPYGDPPKPVHL